MPPRVRPQGPGGPEAPSTFPMPSAHTPSGISGGRGEMLPGRPERPLKAQELSGSAAVLPRPQRHPKPSLRTNWLERHTSGFVC